MVPSGNRKHHEKTEICEVSKGEAVKIWKRLEMFSRLPHIECSFRNKGRRRDVKYQLFNVCNLHVKSGEVNNNNNNIKLNVCIMQFSHL
jgi:hypothetical protein